MTLEELEKKVQALEDLEAIKTLKARFGRACDDKYNPEKLQKLFAEDAILISGTGRACRGKAQIMEYFAEVSRRVTFMVHNFVMPDITIEGNKAHGKWYELSAGTWAGNRGAWLSILFDDEYAKINGEWLITQSKISTFFRTPYEEGWHKKRFLD